MTMDSTPPLPPPRPSTFIALSVPLAILLAGAMIAAAVVWSVQSVTVAMSTSSAAQLAASQAQLNAYQAALAQQQQAAQAAAAAAAAPAAAPQQPVDSTNVVTAGLAFIGKADAPVTMAYWFDYQCPFCQRIEETVMPDLIRDYVSTGKLRVVFKDFAFLGPDSQAAALAGRAIWELAPDKFYDWHKAMFDRQDAENGGWGNRADILALAASVPGIDAAKVDALMTSKATDYQLAMQSDSYEASSMGVSGTPGAIIGKARIDGAQAYAQFKMAVDVALANVGASAAAPTPAPSGTP